MAELAAERNVVLLSDEIYRDFCYDGPFVSPAKFNPQTLVIDGFSKSHGMPGWRLGFAHGPSAIIQEMIKLQQYSFVCAPHPFQWAAAGGDGRRHAASRSTPIAASATWWSTAWPTATNWSRRGGAFYAFPKAPWGTGSRVRRRRRSEHQLLIIPGNVFSRRDTHFRISYAAADAVIERGIEVLRAMA